MPASLAPTLVPELNYVTATGLVNEIKPSASFIRNLLMPQARDQARSTESIELSIVEDDREMAPFVTVDSEPTTVKGLGYTYRTVTTPNIYIERPMTASELMFVRRPGAGVYPTNSTQNAAIRAHIARELERLTRLIENREEWMVCKMLSWTIEYEVQDEAAFTITFPHDSSLDITLTANNFWDDTGINPAVAHRTVTRAIHRAAMMNPSLLILGSEAAEAFEDNAAVKSELDNLNYNIGALDLQRQYLDSEARYIGRWRGVQVWEYARQTKTEAGALTDLLDPKYAYWISTGPRAEYEMNFGAIPNLKLSMGTATPSLSSLGRIRAVPARRFADVELGAKGTSVMGSIQTRPLPQPRRPNVFARVKVVSG